MKKCYVVLGESKPIIHKEYSVAKARAESLRGKVSGVQLRSFKSEKLAKDFLKDLFQKGERGLYLVVHKKDSVQISFGSKAEAERILEKGGVLSIEPKFSYKEAEILKDDLLAQKQAGPLSAEEKRTLQKLKEKRIDNIHISENDKITQEIKNLKKDECIIFTDGSICEDGRKGGWAISMFFAGGDREFLAKSFSLTTSLRSTEAELNAALQAVSQARKHQMKKVKIYHDAIAVTDILHSSPKEGFLLFYKKRILEEMKKMEISFSHIPSHSKILHNEEVDCLAGLILKKRK